MSAKDRLKLACKDVIEVALIQKRFEAEKSAIDARMDANVARAVALRDDVRACRTNSEFLSLLRRRA